jgi:outer membrane immunogenic protein
VALAAPAVAADMPVKAPPPAPIDIWTGGYIGANVGYDWGRDAVDSSGSPGNCSALAFGGCGVAPVNAVSQASAQALSFTTSVNHSGFIYGGQAGHNWLVHNIAWTWDGVLGVEVDFQGKSDSHSNTFSSNAPVPGCPAACAAAFVVAQQATITEKISTLGTLRGRAGVLWGPSTLIYVTGGLAFASATSSASFTQTGVPLFGAVNQPWSSAGGVSTELFGPVIGGGIEWKWTPNLSIKAEYLYADLGGMSFNINGLQSTTTLVPSLIYSSANANVQSHVHDNIARIGINYKMW